MGHGPVAVPEKDAAGADVFQHMTNLGNDRLGRAGDDGIVLNLLLVGAAQYAGRAAAPAAGLGRHRLGRQHPGAGSQAGQVHQGRVHRPLVAGQERIARPLHILARRLLGQFLGFIHMDFPQVADILRPGFIAQLGRRIVVQLKGAAGGFQFRGQHNVGNALFGGPQQGIPADHPRQPDGGMGFLIGAHPGIDMAILEMLALPAEGAGSRPGFDDKLVGFLKPLPVIGRGGIVGDAFPARAAHPAGHQAAAGNHIDHGKLLHQPQGVVPDGQDVAQQDDFGPAGHPGQDGRLDIHGPAHAKGGAVMFVEHQPIEPHLLGVHFLVQVAVVEFRPQLGVIGFVADRQVHNGLAGSPEIAGTRILIRPLGKVADKH